MVSDPSSNAESSNEDESTSLDQATIKHDSRVQSQTNGCYNVDIGSSNSTRRRQIATTDPGNFMRSFQRTVSWSGTLEELETVEAFEENITLGLTEDNITNYLNPHYGSLPLKLRQFSNLPQNLVHFQKHRDSVILYQEKRRQRQLKKAGFGQSRRSTQLHMCRPRLASELPIDPADIDETIKE
jgi:hypothetical protein